MEARTTAAKTLQRWMHVSVDSIIISYVTTLCIGIISAAPTTMAPLAEFDGKVLASSQAISAYVAKLYGKYLTYIHTNSHLLLAQSLVPTKCANDIDNEH